MLYNISRVILFIIFSIISIKEMLFYDGVGLDATIMGFIFMTPVLLCVSFAAASLLSLPIYLVDAALDTTDSTLISEPDNKKKKRYVDYAEFIIKTRKHILKQWETQSKKEAKKKEDDIDETVETGNGSDGWRSKR